MFKNLLKIILYRITPVYKNRWLFMSFEGHYSDSPRKISEALHKMYPEKQINWIVNKNVLGTLPSYVKGIDSDSVEAEWYRDTAAVVIDNVYAGKGFILRRNELLGKLKAFLYSIMWTKRRQHIYTTWHGTPLKRMGVDQLGNGDIMDFISAPITMLLGNSYTEKIMQKLTFRHLKSKVIGSPRNDILFNASEERLKELKKHLGLPVDKKIILFAPTFRNDGRDVEGKNLYRSGINQLSEIDFTRLFNTISKKFDGDWIFVCRFHYHVAEMVDWNAVYEKYNGNVVNGNMHDDMAEYLACTDILVTDASSVMFDFAITGKPCFLYFPDLQHYGTKERGFYIPIGELPYSIAENFGQLLENIEKFDNVVYRQKLNTMINTLGYAEDGYASQNVVDYILKDVIQ